MGQWARVITPSLSSCSQLIFAWSSFFYSGRVSSLIGESSAFNGCSYSRRVALHGAICLAQSRLTMQSQSMVTFMTKNETRKKAPAYSSHFIATPCMHAQTFWHGFLFCCLALKELEEFGTIEDYFLSGRAELTAFRESRFLLATPDYFLPATAVADLVLAPCFEMVSGRIKVSELVVSASVDTIELSLSVLEGMLFLKELAPERQVVVTTK